MRSLRGCDDGAKAEKGQVVEWHCYQCRSYHQYGNVGCVSTCLSENVVRSAVERFLAKALTEGLDLHSYLEDAYGLRPDCETQGRIAGS